LYWNYSGFDAAGAYAGEIQSPKTTYPKAMVLTVVLIAFTCVVVDGSRREERLLTACVA
jgi:amino acid transporter